MSASRSRSRATLHSWGLLGELREFVFDTSLTLLFLGLFVASVIGQSLCGYYFYDQQLSEHGLARDGFWHWLGTGTFLNSAFVNWQAALLQLTVLILAGAYLHQRGASHSRKPEEDEQPNRDTDQAGAGRAHRGSWLRRNSLFAAFLLLFLIFFVAHAFTGQMATNESRALSRMAPVPLGHYVLSSEFWFENFQTWEAEFIAIVIFLILSIYLREQGSPESKKMSASDTETGDTYE
jgi:hypothetical protein